MNALAPAAFRDGAPVFRTEPQRLRFSLADVDLLVEHGVIAENAKIELIDGDLIEMASEGDLHIDYKSVLNQWFVRNLPDGYLLVPDGTLRLGAFDAPEPDLYIFPSKLRTIDVRGPDVSLVIEISQTTQTYDLRRKAELYCRFEVPEYWVIDSTSCRVHVHTSPSVGGYREVRIATYDEALTPLALPELELRMSTLDRINRD